MRAAIAVGLLAALAALSPPAGALLAAGTSVYGAAAPSLVVWGLLGHADPCAATAPDGLSEWRADGVVNVQLLVEPACAPPFLLAFETTIDPYGAARPVVGPFGAPTATGLCSSLAPDAPRVPGPLLCNVQQGGALVSGTVLATAPLS
jgi:hypothetical protein